MRTSIGAPGGEIPPGDSTKAEKLNASICWSALPPESRHGSDMVGGFRQSALWLPVGDYVLSRRHLRPGEHPARRRLPDTPDLTIVTDASLSARQNHPLRSSDSIS